MAEEKRPRNLVLMGQGYVVELRFDTYVRIHASREGVKVHKIGKNSWRPIVRTQLEGHFGRELGNELYVKAEDGIKYREELGRGEVVQTAVRSPFGSGGRN